MIDAIRAGKKPVVVHLAGGLGNQLFQYAFFLHLQNTGIPVICEFGTLPIRLDASGRPWIEAIVSGDLTLKTTRTLNKLVYRSIIHVVNHSTSNPTTTLGKIYSHLVTNLSQSITKTHVIKEVGFSSKLEKIRSGNIFAYCQTHYWLSQNIVNNYLNITNLKQSIYQLAQDELPLVVHIRMGDYAENPQLGIIGQDYYWKAIRSSLKSGNHRAIWLFSDAPAQAISRIPTELQEMVRLMDAPADSPIETLEKMRLGTGYVLANSSLGWWGAYLTYNSNARVLVPNPWFRTQAEPIKLIPARWEKRDAEWERSS